MLLKNLVGRNFGRWRVMCRAKNKNGQTAWLCRCECGRKKVVLRSNLQQRFSRGCRTCGNSKRLPNFRWLYNVVVRNNRRFAQRVMSFEQFLTFTRIATCVYCGALLRWVPISGQKNSHGYNLDRKNSKRGYTKENCVPCCGRCNRIKCEHLTYKEMIVVARVLHLLRVGYKG